MVTENNEKKIKPEKDKVATELEKDSQEPPYSDDYMPDSPQHSILSSRPDLFEENEEALVNEGTVSKKTDEYDEENIEDYNQPD